MATTLLALAIFFVVSLVVSTVIIYVMTKLLGEREGIDTALLAALTGAIIFALSYFFLGQGLFAAIIGGFVWLMALGSLYNMTFLKAVGVAVLVWILAAFVGTVLPTVIGPL